jgi:hypothetical protein
VTDAGVAHLAGLHNLTKLDLSFTQVTDAGLKRLGGQKNLTELGLDGTRVGDDGLRHVAGFANLTRLSIMNTRVTDAGMEHVAGFTNLTHLSLYGLVTDKGLVHLAGLQKLAYLTLGKNITDGGLSHLSGLKSLNYLSLLDTKVKGAGLRHLAGLKNLAYVDVPITDEALRALHEIGLLYTLPQANTGTGSRPTSSEQVVALKFPNTRDQRITDEGLKHLASFKNLTQLDLSFSLVSDEGLKYLVGLDNLAELSLLGCQNVTDAGLQHLAGLKNLTSLTLGHTRVTGTGFKHLVGLKKLTWLAPPITDEVLEALHEAGMLHRLRGTKAAGGRPPTKDEEIVTLDLSNGQLTGDGLKFVAALKNLAVLDLRSTEVNEAWLAELRRTRPNCKIIK